MQIVHKEVPYDVEKIVEKIVEVPIEKIVYQDKVRKNSTNLESNPAYLEDTMRLGCAFTCVMRHAVHSLRDCGLPWG